MASGLVAGEEHAGARGGAVDEAKGCCWTALREQPTTSPKDDRGDGQQVLVLGTGRRLFGDGSARASLNLIERATTKTGVVLARYETATPTR